jgi:acyl-coenzyme A thioesterase PaaI-like protein
MTTQQPGSKMCFVCGVDNPIGLHLDIWMDGEQVWAEFTPGQQHQGWPGVLHGGIQATLLDEIMGRVAFLRHQWMVTVRIEEWRERRMIAVGQILLPDGSVAVEARGVYLRLPEQQKESMLAALSAQGADVSLYE